MSKLSNAPSIDEPRTSPSSVMVRLSVKRERTKPPEACERCVMRLRTGATPCSPSALVTTALLPEAVECSVTLPVAVESVIEEIIG